ncbi:MAG TPA: hypothetical protein VNA26_01860, partial [Chitinophagaceae bacterium]|nr:hypothetical protein [Chitinophagaceae bacterium]
MLNKAWLNYFNKEFFLILTPLFFVLHGFVSYYEAIYWIDGIQLFLVYSAFSVLIAFMLNFAFSSFRKAAIYTFMLVLFNFSFGGLHDSIKQYLGNSFLTRYS